MVRIRSDTTQPVMPAVTRFHWRLARAGVDATVNFRDYLRIFSRGWPALVILTVMGVGGSVGYLLVTPKIYQATSIVYVSTGSAKNAGDLQQGSNFSQQAAMNYAAITRSPLILDPVIKQLGLNTTASELAKSLNVVAVATTTLFTITASSESPGHAAQLANTVARSAMTEITLLEKPENPDIPALVKLSQIQTATVPTDASSPATKPTLAFGLIVGLLLGLVIAILMFVLDTRVRGAQDLAAITDRPILATVPRVRTRGGSLVVRQRPNSSASESFRDLRTNLRFLERAKNRSFVVAVPSAREGESDVAANLAWTLAQTLRTVVLVDIDLRRTSPFGAKASEIVGKGEASQPDEASTVVLGIVDIITGSVGLSDALQPSGHEFLSVLPSGRRASNPSELLGSPEMERFVAQIESRFDYVVFSGPPLMSSTDSAVVSALASGAVVVVNAGRTKRRKLAEAIEVLAKVGVTPIGIVLTGTR